MHHIPLMRMAAVVFVTGTLAFCDESLQDCIVSERLMIAKATDQFEEKLATQGYVYDEELSKSFCSATVDKLSVPIELGAGYHYVMVIIGSEYASDIDSWLKTPDGVIIDSDTGDGTTKVLQMRSDYDAKVVYQYRIYPVRTMPECFIGRLIFRKKL